MNADLVIAVCALELTRWNNRDLAHLMKIAAEEISRRDTAAGCYLTRALGAFEQAIAERGPDGTKAPQRLADQLRDERPAV